PRRFPLQQLILQSTCGYRWLEKSSTQCLHLWDIAKTTTDATGFKASMSFRSLFFWKDIGNSQRNPTILYQLAQRIEFFLCVNVVDHPNILQCHTPVALTLVA